MTKPVSHAQIIIAASVAVVSAATINAKATFACLEAKTREIGMHRYGDESWRLILSLEIASLEAALAAAGLYHSTPYTGHAG